MTTETTHQPEELEQLKEFASRHGINIAIAVGVILVAVLAMLFIGSRSAGAERDALQLLGSARSVSDLESITEKYTSATVAPLALLRTAKVYYDSGNYGLAVQKYDQFANQFVDHPFVAAAKLGKSHCVEAQGRLQEALQGYKQFSREQPRHFLTPQAIFGEGRCLEGLWKLDDARIVYETFIAKQPESPWLDRVESMLASVNRKIKRGDGPPDPTQMPPLSVPVSAQLPELNF